MLLFPEGGRSVSGHGEFADLKEFKEGAAYIAIKAGAPAVPLCMLGTSEVLPMNSMQIMSGVVTLKIGDPIPTANLTLKDRSALTQTLHDRVANLIGESAPEPQHTLIVPPRAGGKSAPVGIATLLGLPFSSLRISAQL